MDQLFRSGHLAYADSSAQKDIAALDIGVVCDFRTDEEQQEHPNRYAEDHTPELISLPVWPIGTPGVDKTVARLLRGDADIDQALADQYCGYREFVREQSAQFAGMFQAVLKNNQRATLLHCSAGKDRTGIASALLLVALGVSQDDARADYLLSAEGHGAIAQTQFYVDKYWAAHISDHGTDPVCTQDEVHRLFSVQMEKIDAAFDEMERVAGSVDDYMRKTLGLTDQARAELLRRYVEEL